MARFLQKVPHILVFVVGLFLTLLAAILLQERLEIGERLQFDRAASSALQGIPRRIERYENALVHTMAMFSAKDKISQNEFRVYVEGLGLRSRYPGIQGLGYTIRIPAGELAEHEKTVQKSGYPSYQVWPNSPRSEYFSIVYIEPFDWRNQRAFGFDMSSDKIRRAAMERARDTGRPTLSNKVTLVQETDTNVQPGFLMYVPVFTAGPQPQSIEERRHRLTAFVYAPFRSYDLFDQIFKPMVRRIPTLDVEIFDGAVPQPGNKLYDSDGIDSYFSTERRPRFAITEKLTVAGQEWSVYIASFDRDGERLVHLAQFSVGGFGLFANTLLFLFLRARSRRSEEQKNHAIQIAEERARLNTFFQLSPALVTIFRGSGHVIELANPRSLEFIGEPVELGKTRAIECERLVKLAPLILLDSVFSSGQTESTVETAVTDCAGGNSPVCFFNTVVQAIRSAAGSIDGVMLHAIEVTSQVDARHEIERLAHDLRASKEHYRRLIETARVIAWESDVATGEFSYVSPQAQEILGFPLTEWFKPEFRKRLIHPDDRDLAMATFDHAAAKGEGMDFEYRMVAASGQIVWMRDIVSPVEYQGQKVLTGFMLDITQKKANEFALQEALAVRDEFLSIASHELRTPLAPLKLHLQGLVRLIERGRWEDVPREKVANLSSIANKQVERLQKLIDNLLDVSRISAGKLRLNLELTDLSGLVVEVMERFRPELEANGSTLSLEVDSELPVAHLDKLRIEQVVTNLIVNAAKYAPGSLITVRISPLPEGLRLEVQDEGPGIADEDQAKIFDRYERVSSTQQAGGLGLGLYISRQIVEAHGGRIDVTSQLGQGCTFWVEIPFSPQTGPHGCA